MSERTPSDGDPAAPALDETGPDVVTAGDAAPSPEVDPGGGAASTDGAAASTDGAVPVDGGGPIDGASSAGRGSPAGDESPTGVAGSRAGDSHSDSVRRWRERSRRRREKPKRPLWIELPILVVISFALTFLIQTFIARVYYVPSGSMEPTLHGTTHGGDRILAYKLVYDFRGPRQGEVVVFKGPATWTPEANIPGPSSWLGKAAQALGSVVGIAPPNEKDYVKRVIAVGGQTVSCCDVQGRVQVDGQSLNEPYVYIDPGMTQWMWIDGVTNCDPTPSDPAHFNSVRCFGPYTVPQGMVWVMGDHRSDSADSSYQCRGLVPAPNVQCQGPIPVDDVIGKAVFIVLPPTRWGTIGSPDIMPTHGTP